MTRKQFLSVCEKLGLIVEKDEDDSLICAYLPGRPYTNNVELDEIESIADYDTYDQSAQFYSGIRLEYEYSRGLTFRYTGSDVINTKSFERFNQVMCGVVKRYNQILPILKVEKMNAKLDKINTDF